MLNDFADVLADRGAAFSEVSPALITRVAETDRRVWSIQKRITAAHQLAFNLG